MPKNIISDGCDYLGVKRYMTCFGLSGAVCPRPRWEDL